MRKNKKYMHLISKGLNQPLQNVPFHMKAPLKRILLQDHSTFPEGEGLSEGSDFHIAAHFISNLPKKVPAYVDYHQHDCDEINLLLSEKGKLVYEYFIDNEKYIVSSPAVVYLPKNVKHKMRAIRGNGIYICIVMSKNYKTSISKGK
jgi:mannose-6-phosphate isomerase-like protein (cupin superfamily)